MVRHAARSLLARIFLAGAVFLPAIASALPGELDPTFGNNGVVRMGLGLPASFRLEATALQYGPGGAKTIVAGTVVLPSGEHGVLIGRFDNFNGDLDTTFGASGWVVLGTGSSETSEVRGLAIASDLGVVVLVKSGGRTGLARRQPDGSPYQSYGYPPEPDIYFDSVAESMGFEPRAVAMESSSYYIFVAGSVPADETQRGRDSFGFVYPGYLTQYNNQPVAASRYSIGGGDDEILAIVASSSDVFIAGRTREPGGNDDAFVAKVSSYLGPLYSTVLIDNQGNDDSATNLYYDYGRLLVGGSSRDSAGAGRFFVSSVMAFQSPMALDTTFGSSGTTVLEVPAFSGDSYDATLRSLVYTGYDLVLAGDARNLTTGESRLIATLVNSYTGQMEMVGPMAGWTMGGYYEMDSRDEVLVGAHAPYQYGNTWTLFGRHTSGGFQQVGVRRLWGASFDDYFNPPNYPSAGIKLKAWQRPTLNTVVGLVRTQGFTYVLGASDDDTVLARLAPNGSLDQADSYRPAILRLTPAQYPFEPVGLAKDSQGRLVIASDGGAGTFVATRYDGYYMQPDFGFGSGGTLTVAAGNATASAAAVGADDFVAIAGSYVGGDGKTHPAIARITPYGTVDPTFNGGSTLLLPGIEMAPRAAAFTADGKLVLAGTVATPDGPGVVARIAPDGSVDWVRSFAGSPNYPQWIFNSIAIAADGTVYASGVCNVPFDHGYCSVGISPNGEPSDFGVQMVKLSGRDDDAVASGLTVDGKLIVAGDSYHTSEFKAIALHADGSRDNTYAAPYGVAASGQYGVSMKGAIDTDGTFILAGETLEGDWLLVKWQSPNDTVPAPFTFGSVNPVPIHQMITSPSVTIDGTGGPTTIRSINNTPYSIGCNGSFTSDDGTINSGQAVCIQVASAFEPGTSTTGGIFVGGVKGTFTVTTGTAPEIGFTQTPPSPTGQAVAVFQFGTNDPSAQLQCTLDGAPVGPCASPYQTPALSDGAHSFTVVAVGAGGSSSPAQHSWTVDTVAPSIVFDGQPPALTTSPAATIAFHASDASALAFVECRLDGGSFASCASPVNLSNLAPSPHTFEVRVTDAAGNAATSQIGWTVDNLAPNTAIASGPPALSNAGTSTFVFSSDDPSATFECDGTGAGNSFFPCDNPTSFSNATLADGTYTLLVRARDAAGNVDTSPAAWTFTLDRVAPETSLNYAPTGITNQATATASFFSEAGATFECRIDGAAYVACTSPVTYNDLAEGAHSIDIRAKDAAGNVDPTPSSSSWAIDRTAPDTNLTAGPSGTVSQSSGSFTFSSPDPGATFQCAVDGNSWFGCASPHPFQDLADGTHLFEVRAVDAAQNFDPSAASRTWTIDTTAPSTSIITGPDAVTPFVAASFTFTSPDGASFQCSLDGAAFAPCASPANYSGLAGGGHSFSVYAIDAAGNADASPATWSWAVDITAPDTTIVSGPGATVATTSATIAFSSDDGAATFECRLDAAAFAPCASPASLTGLAQGAHTYEVRAKDAVGNVDGTPASRTWTVDTVAPDTSITSAPPAATNSASASFSFTATEGGTFECKLDAGAYAACTSPKAYAGLATGSHTFSVRAKDAAGNTDASPASAAWTIDTTAPDTTITGGPSGNNNPNTATFAFTATEAGSTFECKLDTGAFAACTSPKTYTALPKGSHTFQVRAKDPAGNTDATPATRNWTSK